MSIKKGLFFIAILFLVSCEKKVKNVRQVKLDKFEQIETAKFDQLLSRYEKDIEIVKLFVDNKIGINEFFEKIKDIVYSRFDHDKNDKPFSNYRYTLENDINYITYLAYKENLGKRSLKIKAIKFLEELNLLDQNILLIPELSFERRCR